MNLTPLQNTSPVPETQDKLWILASSPFLVVGEARVAADGDLALSWLGDGGPETKLGLAPGTFPKTIREALALIHPDDVPGFQQTLARSLATGMAFDARYRLADGRGGWRWIEGRAVPTEAGDGQWVGWIFINRDFTAQYEAEAALRQSVRELEASRSGRNKTNSGGWPPTPSPSWARPESRRVGWNLSFSAMPRRKKSWASPPAASR